VARGVLLHHDNTKPHTARATQERFQEILVQWELLEHPPYSPDLAPSDFHLFGPLKNHFGDKRFADDEEIETEVWKWLRQQSKDFYHLRCGSRRTGKAMGKVCQCWWRLCREIIIFSCSNITCFTFYTNLWLFTDSLIEGRGARAGFLAHPFYIHTYWLSLVFVTLKEARRYFAASVLDNTALNM
jgi:hypothetical protein